MIKIKDRKLSTNFTLYEYLHSDIAERHEEWLDEQYNPPLSVITSIEYTNKTLQTIRDKLHFPIHINSGYRSDIVNAAIGSRPTSQHRLGEAADCSISDSFRFLHSSTIISIKSQLDLQLKKSVRIDVNANFYLFAFVVLNLEQLDIDQVIHEYGRESGQPAWVHISVSTRQNKRQILSIGSYNIPRTKMLTVDEALSLGT